MSRAILILGESGSGKSTSMRNLDPKTTGIINCIGKDLPFPGWKKNYTLCNSKDNPQGNMWEGTNADNLIKILKYIDQQRPEIRTIVIDDLQYIMSYEFIARVKEVGFQKFNDLAAHMFSVIDTARNLRKDLTVFFLSHIENGTDVFGNKLVKIKTVGKLLDEKITIEGLFSSVLLCQIEKSKEGFNYYFLTKSDGNSTVKSPMGMFDEKIDNDLNFVINRINQYELGE